MAVSSYDDCKRTPDLLRALLEVVVEKVLARLRTPSNSGGTGDAHVSASF
jgi:hypothetical protein